MKSGMTRWRLTVEMDAVAENGRIERTPGVFIADDKFVDVIRVLERRGWVRSRHSKSPNFLLKWRNLSNIKFRMLRGDQFVNHVFNSQQLSNKALLADHLAFQHHRLRHQPHRSNADSSDFAPDVDGINGCSYPVVKKGMNSTADPEAFFPRCFSVQDGALSALLEAFVVSAAVALIRRDMEVKNAPRSGVTLRDINPMDVLRAASSVISRYITHKHVTSSQNTPEPARTCRGTAECVKPAHSSDHPTLYDSVPRACYAARVYGVALSMQDPDCVAVVSAWEAIATKAGETSEEEIGADDKDLTNGDPDYDMTPPSRHATGAAAVCTEGSVFIRALQSEKAIASHETTTRGAAPSLMAKGNDWDGRASWCLQALEAIDPQAALLGTENAWIVKPAGLSCGRGVRATRSLRGLLLACQQLGWKAVVQKYVERPLLVQGYKFDIRQWILVTSCNPLVVWGFDECYVRFASKPFTMSTSKLSDKFVHLCNHSVQKERGRGDCGAFNEGGGRESFEGQESRPSGSRGHMWTADQLGAYLLDRFEGDDVFRDIILPRIRAVAVQTLLAVRESLEMRGKALEWLGFDLMLTEDLRVMLLEVNVSPDVSHSTPVTARLVPVATEDALALLLDDGLADARAAALCSSGHRHEVPQRHPGTEDGKSKPRKSTTSKSTTEFDECQACARGGGAIKREAELRADEVPRWRLWHKGEEELAGDLGSLREAKKIFFEARRQLRRQGKSPA